jgi:RHS repeat-associated protein
MTHRFRSRLAALALCSVASTVLVGEPLVPQRAAAADAFASIGQLKHFRFESERLTDRIDLRVNVAAGNVVVHAKDLHLSSTGLPLAVELYYNSLSTASSELGSGWVMSLGKDVRLDPQPNGDVAYFGPSGFRVVFRKNPDGSFQSPQGVEADLEKKPDGTYELTFFSSKEQYRFDALGRWIEQVDRNNNKNVFSYAADGTLSSALDSRSRRSVFSYSRGRLISIKDPSGRLSSFTYGTAQRLATYTNPAGGRTSFEYSQDGLMTRITDPRGAQIVINYDGARRATSVVRVTDARMGTGPTTLYSYSSDSSTVTDPNGHKTTYKYDQDKRVTRVTDAKGKSKDVSYNARSNVTTFLDAGAQIPLTFDYDPTGNDVTKVTLPTSGSANLKYEDAENPHSPTSIFDFQNDSKTEPTYSYEYDERGNLIAATDRLGARYKYSYHSNGTLKEVTDPSGHVTTYTYNSLGEMTRIQPPAPLKPTTLSYDSVSRIRTITDGNGNVTTLAYDPNDRVLNVSYSDGTATAYAYDPNGNVTSRQDSKAGKTNLTYDTLNRLVKETPPSLGGLLTYTYDAVGNMTSASNDGGTTYYQYDEVNMLTSAKDALGNMTTFEYDQDRDTLRTATNYPNGVKIAIDYDGSGRLAEIKTTNSSSAVLSKLTYGYETPNGLDSVLRQDVTDESGNKTTFGYDLVNRLTSVTKANAQGVKTDVHTYRFDQLGNLTSKVDNGNQTTLAYNAANELCWTSKEVTSGACATPPPSAVSNTYDAAGNLTGSSGGLGLAYNARNQTISARAPGGAAEEMSYEGPGETRRISRGKARFGYNLLGLAAQTAGSSGVANTTYFTRDNRGVLLSERLPGGKTYYYLFDGLGSVTGLTDGSGKVVATYDYDPWGRQTSAEPVISNPWRFASGYMDQSTGFVKFGTRYYVPSLARWTQQDPSGGTLTSPDSLNAYAYASDNPINRIDPSGLAYLDLSFSLGHYTFGVAINEEGDAHPYVGGGGGLVPASASFSLGSGKVRRGPCAQAQGAYWGGSVSGGYCPGSGKFGEVGVGTPQLSGGGIYYF